MSKPNPGSDEALKQGCSCPQEDNGHGKGAAWQNKDSEPNFWVNRFCPIHGMFGENDERD